MKKIRQRKDLGSRSVSIETGLQSNRSVPRRSNSLTNKNFFRDAAESLRVCARPDRLLSKAPLSRSSCRDGARLHEVSGTSVRSRTDHLVFGRRQRRRVGLLHVGRRALRGWFCRGASFRRTRRRDSAAAGRSAGGRQAAGSGECAGAKAGGAVAAFRHRRLRGAGRRQAAADRDRGGDLSVPRSEQDPRRTSRRRARRWRRRITTRAFRPSASQSRSRMCTGGVVALKVTELKVGRLRVKNSRYFDLDTDQGRRALAEGRQPFPISPMSPRTSSRSISGRIAASRRRCVPAWRPAPSTSISMSRTRRRSTPASKSTTGNRRPRRRAASAATVHYDNLWQLGHSPELHLSGRAGTSERCRGVLRLLYGADPTSIGSTCPVLRREVEQQCRDRRRHQRGRPRRDHRRDAP